MTNVTHIESTSGFRGGRARISGTRITVDDVVILHLRVGLLLEQLVAKYQLDPAAVHAALAYYCDHKVEIDKLIADDEAYVEAFKRDHPSRLQDRFQARRRA